MRNKNKKINSKYQLSPIYNRTYFDIHCNQMNVNKSLNFQYVISNLIKSTTDNILCNPNYCN